MKKLVYSALFALLATVCHGQNKDNLEKIFLDLKYTNDIKTLFDSIEKNPNFKLKTNRINFMNSWEFDAKYIGKSEVYTNADSVIISVVTCNDGAAPYNPGEINCKSIKVLYYLKDANAIETNYQRMDGIITSSIASNKPDWKNQTEASKGAYYLTDKPYPFIALDKKTFKGIYLTIRYTSFEK